MKTFYRIFKRVAAPMVLVGILGFLAAPSQGRAEKTGILVVSFGTTHLDTLARTIEATEQRIASAFPDYEVRRAFTSYMIVSRLAERHDMRIDKPEESLAKMKADGFTTVVVQPLHLLAGSEYHEKILRRVATFRDDFDQLLVGRPALFRMKDYDAVIDALESQLPDMTPPSQDPLAPKDRMIVWMGHGTHHPANSAYPCLQSKINDRGLPMLVGTVEGYPEIDWILRQLQAQSVEVKNVTLAPLMLVAGDHAKNDMAGEDSDSWKSILSAQGYQVDVYLHGLGENPQFQQLYVESIEELLDGESEHE